MSRYFALLILNLPFILAGMLSITTQFKIRHVSKKKFITQLIVWIMMLMGLILAEPIYNWLFASGLTQSDSLSLFDVIQITAIVLLFYVTNRMRYKLDNLERRVQDLHQELSIRLSKQ